MRQRATQILALLPGDASVWLSSSQSMWACHATWNGRARLSNRYLETACTGTSLRGTAEPGWRRAGRISPLPFCPRRYRFHPNQAPPTRFESKFVFNWQIRIGPIFLMLAFSYTVSHTRRLRDLQNHLIAEVWLWLSLLLNGIIRYVRTSPVKE